MRKRSPLIIMLILLGSIAYSQNYLLDNNQNSFHIRSRYTKMVANVSLLEVEPGYTINGKLTLKLNYRHFLFGSLPVTNKIYFMGTGIDYLLIKQNKFPLSVSVGMNYELGLLEYRESLEFPTGSGTQYIQLHELNLYSKLSHRFDINTDWAVVPSVSLGTFNRNYAYPENYSSGDRTTQLPNSNNMIYSIQSDVLFRSFYAFIRANFYSQGIDNPISIAFSTTDFGIGVLLNRRTK